MDPQILHQLLFDEDFRHAYWAGEPVGSPDELDALSAIDHEQLDKTVRRIERDVFESLQGFKESWGRVSDWGALTRSFMKSPEFARSSEAPVDRPCISIEEAFYRFLLPRLREPEERERLEREFFTAIMEALAKNQDPFFQILDSRIVRSKDGYHALINRGSHNDLYAAIGSQTVIGQI